MEHAKVIATLGSLSVIAVFAMVSGYEPIAYLAAGALVGYLGKVNGGDKRDSRPPID
jgi:hypothetical protein